MSSVAPRTKKPEKDKGPAAGHDPLRTEAEKKLAGQPAVLPGQTEGRTPEELIHELQVHQVELEMQNEALREARLALEVSRDKYLDLYEFAPAGYMHPESPSTSPGRPCAG